MNHNNLEKQSSTAPMLPEKEKVVIITGNNKPMGKILLREDTILGSLQRCTSCGQAQYKCGVQSQFSSLCWGKEWDKNFYCVLSLSAVFVLSLIGTILFCFTDTVNDAIMSNMAIRNNSLAFEMWKYPSVQPLMKVHIFNYTNWKEVRDDPSIKLKVEDVGPFVYRQHIERVNIEFNGDEQVTFQEKNDFTFLPEKSGAKEFDQITVPNLPLLGVSNKAMSLGLNAFQLFPVMNLLRLADHQDAFLDLPAQRFLWGYEDSIMNVAKPILSIQGQMPQYENFGLLASKNGTLKDRLTINTGVHDFTRMNMIEAFNGGDKLDYWESSECDSIESSDGSIFPPSQLDRTTRLQVLLPNLCRRVTFDYEKDVQSEDGVDLLRYRMPLNVFDSGERNPANQCYCHVDSGNCPPSGVVNITVCTMGAPAMISFPHFYLGDPSLRSQIDGLNPDPNLHDSYIDIHPTLGIVLGGKSSLQINLQVRKAPTFYALSFLPDDLIMPVAWLEITVEDLPDNIRSLIYHGTYSTAAIHLGLTVSCIILLTASGVCLLLVFIRRQRPKPCATIKQYNLENADTVDSVAM